jgi:hypothetical protein
MVADVANIQISVWTELNAVRLLELRFVSRTAIARIACLTRPRNRADHSLHQIDLPHCVILHVDYKQITLPIEAQFVGQIESRIKRGSAISGVSLLPGPSHRADFSVGSDAADALSRVLAEPNRSIRSAHHPKRIVNLRKRCGASIAGKTLGTVSGKCLDPPLGAMQRSANKRKTQSEPNQCIHGSGEHGWNLE